MIRSEAGCGMTIGMPRRFYPWVRGCSYVLVAALVFLTPLPASAGSNKVDSKASRQERVKRHESKRGDIPRNARYKNPPREDRARREKSPGSLDRARSDRGSRGQGDARRYDDWARRSNERHDRAGRGDRHGEKHDNRHHGKYDNGHHGKHNDRYHAKPHYRPRYARRYRSRVYHHYDYFPYYVPVAVAYPYYCDLCHSGFHAQHLFYDHLFDFHSLARAQIPGLLFSFGGTFYFDGW